MKIIAQFIAILMFSIALAHKSNAQIRMDRTPAPAYYEYMAYCYNGYEGYYYNFADSWEKAICTGNIHAVEELIKNGVDINKNLSGGFPAISFTAVIDLEDLAKFLINNGAKTNIIDDQGYTPLYIAINERHLNISRLLIENGGSAPTSKICCKGDTYTEAAAEWLQEDIHRLLIENGAFDPEIYLKAKEILKGSIIEDKPYFVELLLKKGANVNASFYETGTLPIGEAIRRFNKPLVKFLIEHGADVNKVIDSSSPAICFSLNYSSNSGWAPAIDMVDYLINMGSNPNIRCLGGEPPLNYASGNGAPQEIIDMLIEAGADINATDSNSLTSLTRALENEHFHTATYLLSKGARAGIFDYAMLGDLDGIKRELSSGADINKTDHNGISLLMLAVSYNHSDVAEYLIESGANIFATDDSDDQYPVVFYAVMNNMLSTVKLLLQKGVSVNTKTPYGSCIMQSIANSYKVYEYYKDNRPVVLQDYTEMIEFLLDEGHDINCTDSISGPLLYVMVVRGDPVAVKILLDHGANPNVIKTDNSTTKWTPMISAALGCKHGIAQLLIEHGAFVIDSELNNNGINPELITDPLTISAMNGCVEVLTLLTKHCSEWPEKDEFVNKLIKQVIADQKNEAYQSNKRGNHQVVLDILRKLL